MIPRDAVIYSGSFFEDSMCLLVAQYAGLNVIKRLSETESRAGNPVLGRYLGEVLGEADDDRPVPFTLLVGNMRMIGEAFRGFITAHAIVVIDCEAAYGMIENPEESAPPVCPAVAGSYTLIDDLICPEQYECLSEEDRGEYAPSMVRCFFEEVDEAACPSRKNFHEVLAKREVVLEAARAKNREILTNAFFGTRDELIRFQATVENEHAWRIYSKMRSYLIEGGKPLQHKDVARKLNDDGVRTKEEGDKLFESDDIRQLLRRLDKTEEWRVMNNAAGRFEEIRNKSARRRTNLEKLMLLMSEPRTNGRGQR